MFRIAILTVFCLSTLLTISWAPSAHAEMWDGYCDLNLSAPPPPPSGKLKLPALSLDSLFTKNLRGETVFDSREAFHALDESERELIVNKIVLGPNGFFGSFGLQLVTASAKRSFYIVDGKDKYALGNLITDAKDNLSAPESRRKDFRPIFGKIAYALFYSSLAYEHRAYSPIVIKSQETLGMPEGSPEVAFPNSLSDENFYDMQRFVEWLNESPARATYAAHVFGESLSVFLAPEIYKAWLGPEDSYKHAYFYPKKFQQMIEAQQVDGMSLLNPLILARRYTFTKLQSMVLARLNAVAAASPAAGAASTEDLYMPQTPLLRVEQAPYAIGDTFAVDFMSVLDIKDFKTFKNKTLAAVEIAETFANAMKDETDRLATQARQQGHTPKRLFMLRTRLDSVQDDYTDMRQIIDKSLSVLSDTAEAAANRDYQELADQLTAQVAKSNSIRETMAKAKANLDRANQALN